MRQLLPLLAAATAAAAPRHVLPLIAATAATRYLEPDLLEFANGSAVTAETWPARRDELKTLLETKLLGAAPPSPPLTNWTRLNRTAANGVASSFYRLTFDVSEGGETDEIAFVVEALSPAADGIRPLVLTQPNHRDWCVIGASRGFACVVFPAGDTIDAAPDFQAAYV